MTHSQRSELWHNAMFPSVLVRIDAVGRYGGNTNIISHITLSGTSESLNGKDFAFLHLGLISSLDNGHALATMDDVLIDVMPVQVTDCLNGVCGSIDLDFIALHGFLDSCSNVAHADIDTGFLVRY